MMLEWFDGHLVLALILAPVFAVWLVGIVNILIRRHVAKVGAR